MSDYLIHWGIKGQRKGFRRFQNEDGSLTPEGRERYLGSSSGRQKYLKVLNKDKKKYSQLANGLERSGNKAFDQYASISINKLSGADFDGDTVSKPMSLKKQQKRLNQISTTLMRSAEYEQKAHDIQIQIDRLVKVSEDNGYKLNSKGTRFYKDIGLKAITDLLR
jgi:hypothetical protein